MLINRPIRGMKSVITHASYDYYFIVKVLNNLKLTLLFNCTFKTTYVYSQFIKYYNFRNIIAYIKRVIYNFEYQKTICN